MKTLVNIFAIIAVICLSSCSDQMYVKAPCDINDLNINGSLAQELGITSEQDNMAQLDLSLNYGTSESYRVQVYSADPTTEENSYLLAYYILNDETTTELLCNLPENMNNLYVGITDALGNRVVKSVAMLNGKANVEFGNVMASSK